MVTMKMHKTKSKYQKYREHLMKKRRFTCEMTDSEYDQLFKCATSEEKTMSAYVRDLIAKEYKQKFA